MIEAVEVKFVSSQRNLYRVPKRQWGKWRGAGQKVFNEVYSAMRANQDLFVHPAQVGRIAKSNWKTTAWNAAWIAASAARNAGRLSA